jgi:hypothetical protein
MGDLQGVIFDGAVEPSPSAVDFVRIEEGEDKGGDSPCEECQVWCEAHLYIQIMSELMKDDRLQNSAPG